MTNRSNHRTLAWTIVTIDIVVVLIIVVILQTVRTTSYVESSSTSLQTEIDQESIPNMPEPTSIEPVMQLLATDEVTEVTLSGESSTSNLKPTTAFDQPTEEPVVIETPTATEVVDSGLDFALETVDGIPFRLSDYRGQVVVVFAMIVGCGTCAVEARSWGEVLPEYKDRGVELLVLSLNPKERVESLNQFLAVAGGLDATTAIDRDGSVSELLEIRALDQTIVFDRTGQVAYVDYAPTSPDDLRTILDSALVG